MRTACRFRRDLDELKVKNLDNAESQFPSFGTRRFKSETERKERWERSRGNAATIEQERLTANGFVAVVTSPVIRYEIFREHGTLRSVVAPVVHLAASEKKFHSRQSIPLHPRQSAFPRR